MATKLNKLIVIFILMNSSLLGYSQGEKYTIIPIESIMIDSFKYGGVIQNFIELIGKPKSYKEYIDPYPLEGYGKTFYLTYDSLKATFVEFYEKIILSKIAIIGSNYSIKIGSSSIQVGDPLYKLSQFKKSYDFFSLQHKKPYENNEQHFYINLLIKTIDYEYYGLINIKLKEDIVTEIAFRFDEGS